MPVMKEIEFEFVTNANQTGKMTFKRVKQGVNPKGNNVYIYSRTKMDGTLFSYEVIVPNIKKAGTYPLPGDKTITYTEDFEEYPGASVFGRIAWEFHQWAAAEAKFNLLTAVAVPEVEEEAESNKDYIPGDVCRQTPAPKRRGRQKGPRPVLTMPPVGELFSVKELAAKNNVEYIVADVFRKEALGKTIQFVKTERRNPKGKETSLYTAIQPA